MSTEAIDGKYLNSTTRKKREEVAREIECKLTRDIGVVILRACEDAAKEGMYACQLDLDYTEYVYWDYMLWEVLNDKAIVSWIETKKGDTYQMKFAWGK